MSTTVECSLWWLVAIASELSGGSSSGALHENCGHVPEVKTQPQNTDRITRRIILDYIPLSKGACQTRPAAEGIENSGNSIEKIAFGSAAVACRHLRHGTPQRARIGGGQVRLLAFWRLFVRNL